MLKSIVDQLLKSVDSKITIVDDTFYTDMLTKPGTLAVGEAYMHDKIKVDDLDTELKKLYKLSMSSMYDILGFKVIFLAIIYIHAMISFIFNVLMNRQTVVESVANVDHYNLNHEFYEQILGNTMQYSCAYFTNGDLDNAQENKITKIINKLKLEDNMRVIEIGSGYGYLAHQIKRSHPNVNMLGINISRGQIMYGNDKYTTDGLLFMKIDYRNLPIIVKRQYDRVVSVGMFEHVGRKNYRDFFKIVENILTDGGIFVLHSIMSNQRYLDSTDPWLHKYIFPGGMIPNLIDVLESIQGTSLKCEHVEDFGHHYSKTLSKWLDNLKTCDKLDNDIDRKMFEYYFSMCKVSFDIGNLSLKQVVLSKKYNKVYSI